MLLPFHGAALRVEPDSCSRCATLHITRESGRCWEHMPVRPVQIDLYVCFCRGGNHQRPSKQQSKEGCNGVVMFELQVKCIVSRRVKGTGLHRVSGCGAVQLKFEGWPFSPTFSKK